MGSYKSRPARWAEATERARAALTSIEDAKGELTTAFEDLRDLQEEYQEWLDGLAEVSQGTAMEEKLQAVTGLDLEPDVDFDVSEAEGALDEAEGADLPLGFGKD